MGQDTNCYALAFVGEKVKWTSGVVKAFSTSLGKVRGPIGVSFAASYRGSAKRAKPGTQCLKDPTNPKKERI